MKEIFKKHLFEKHIFVSDTESKSKNSFEVVYSMARIFQIKIVSGCDNAKTSMIILASKELGVDVPAPFYKGFPESVRKLSSDALLFDQMLSYARTYGVDDFSAPVHSVLEKYVERSAFNEKVPSKEFVIMTEYQAVQRLKSNLEDLLKSTRPLADDKFELLVEFIKEYEYEVTFCASKNTAIKLIIALKDESLADFIVMSDVIKLLEEINFCFYDNDNVKKLNLKNIHRKLIASVMDRMFVAERIDLQNCYEKKAIWNGLLHHIHYKPSTKQAKEFVDAMRGNENKSAYSAFEKHMVTGEIREAMNSLQRDKGGAAVIRNLNYIVSRCMSREDVEYVIEHIDSANMVVLLQLYMQYANPVRKCNGRVFQYTKFNMIKVHKETKSEFQKRKSFLSHDSVTRLCVKIEQILKDALRNKLGKVFIDDKMKNIALPIKEMTSSGGFGILPKGSRLQIPEGKKIRVFTYWEKVDDIDLSVIGVSKDGEQTEFSWRTMYDKQNDAITYSGDVTSGYNGGSEYYDVDIACFKDLYPNIEYLVFCNNVYSRVNFSNCVCRAGFMLRNTEDRGVIFEPKTVDTSFTINCLSTFAYLFGIDLMNNQFVWLNTAKNSSAVIAGVTDLNFLTEYFYITSCMNVYYLFEMMATEIVDDPKTADIVVSDQCFEISEDIEQIHSYDIEKIMSYIE